MIATTNSLTASSNWNESYLLNIKLIDKQHQYFFKMFDELLLLSKEINKEPEIIDYLVELQKYSNNHFRTEEALMKKSDFEGLDLHIIQHQLFVNKVYEFKIAYNYKNTVLLTQMITFMRKWLLTHISDMDKKYADSVINYLKNK